MPCSPVELGWSPSFQTAEGGALSNAESDAGEVLGEWRDEQWSYDHGNSNGVNLEFLFITSFGELVLLVWLIGWGTRLRDEPRA